MGSSDPLAWRLIVPFLNSCEFVKFVSSRWLFFPCNFSLPAVFQTLY